MSLSAHAADASLAALTGCYLVLHTGDPGANGTANVAVKANDDPMAPKAVSFAAVSNHPSNTERRRLSDGAVSFDGTELKPGQTLTHFSFWDGAAGPGTDDPLHIAALSASKLTGSDGAAFAIGALEAALAVYAKP
ncbi:MAG: hypothetical protein ABS36_11040 [Acidobacteria bacterium SCN 69-37]|nr:MAG: hypothetical protein ABS36_11040 [Acidobacteria bacterium SCN 69-37]